MILFLLDIVIFYCRDGVKVILCIFYALGDTFSFIKFFIALPWSVYFLYTTGIYINGCGGLLNLEYRGRNMLNCLP